MINTALGPRCAAPLQAGSHLRSDRGTQMIRGTPRKPSSGLDESLDAVDEEALDSALMDLLTSDWQSLDDGEATEIDTPDDWPPPAAKARAR